MVCGGRAAREHVLDRAGATKLLRWQPCGLAAHGRRGGVPMKRSERRWPEKNARFSPIELRGPLRCSLCPRKRTFNLEIGV